MFNTHLTEYFARAENKDVTLNVTIYNVTNFVGFAVHSDIHITKALNIFPQNIKCHLLPDMWTTRRSITRIMSDDATQELVTYGGGDEAPGIKYVMMTVPTVSFDNNIHRVTNSNTLKNVWWLNKYLSVPSCAAGRLLQISGTCWYNTTLNALMLTQRVRQVFAGIWHASPPEYKTKIENFGTLETCPMKNMLLKDMLHFLIYHLVVKGDKIKARKDNTVIDMAGSVKAMSELGLSDDASVTVNQFNQNDRPQLRWTQLKTILTQMPLPEDFKTFGNNWFESADSNSIKRWLNALLSTTDKEIDIQQHLTYMISILKDWARLINAKAYEVDSKYNPDLRATEAKLNMHLGSFKTGHEIMDIKEIEQTARLLLIVLTLLKSKGDEGHNSFDATKVVLDMLKLSYMASEIDVKYLEKPQDAMPMFLLIGNQSENVQREITFGKKAYELLSAGVAIGKNGIGTHAIAGLMCNGKAYIYDANNYIAHTDWPACKFDAYYRALHNNNCHYKDNRFVQFDHLLYMVKDDDNNAIKTKGVAGVNGSAANRRRGAGQKRRPS